MEAKPIAQASVLRWVLMGGNINESKSFLAWPYRLCPGVSTAVPRLLCGVWWCQERAGAWFVWVVFGALLGPEATGPGGFCFPGLVCFWFPGCTGHARWPLWGLCVGCVVRGCCLRTT